MSAPAFRVILGALARYLPGLSGTRFLYAPVAVVVVLPIVFQWPDTRRWILTGTSITQPVNPSLALTTPRASRCFLSLSVTLLVCVVLTVKLVVLVAEPTGVVTSIGPVAAPAGTVAVISVDETALNVEAEIPLNVTLVAPVAERSPGASRRTRAAPDISDERKPRPGWPGLSAIRLASTALVAGVDLRGEPADDSA
jgi:hypothetical protein